MTRRAPFASVWSAHHRSERLLSVLRWGAFWGSTALIALLAAIAIVCASGAALHGGITP